MSEYKRTLMIARDIRIAKRRGQYTGVDEYLRAKRRERRFPDPLVRADSRFIEPVSYGTYRIPAAPSLEDYDKGYSR